VFLFVEAKLKQNQFGLKNQHYNVNNSLGYKHF